MSLQEKIHGHHRYSSTLLKKMGSYQGAPLRRMGFHNNKPKMLGHYNGAGEHKSNISMETHAHY